MKSLASIFTTSAPIGVTMRYLGLILGGMLTVLGIVGWLSAEQIAELRAQIPDLTAAIGALMTAVIAIYGIIRKSHSDKAAEAAKAIDAEIPPEQPVIVKTPSGRPDIVISVK